MSDNHQEQELDAELTAEERAELESLTEVGDMVRRAADDWDRGVSFDGFYEKVAARIEPIQPSAPSFAERIGNWFQWSVRHPATAAAFTILIVVGAGSAYWASRTAPIPQLQMRGGGAEILDLEIESDSAVVYKTDSDVTVIWISEDDE